MLVGDERRLLSLWHGASAMWKHILFSNLLKVVKLNRIVSGGDAKIKQIERVAVSWMFNRQLDVVVLVIELRVYLVCALPCVGEYEDVVNVTCIDADLEIILDDRNENSTVSASFVLARIVCR